MPWVREHPSAWKSSLPILVLFKNNVLVQNPHHVRWEEGRVRSSTVADSKQSRLHHRPSLLPQKTTRFLWINSQRLCEGRRIVETRNLRSGPKRVWMSCKTCKDKFKWRPANKRIKLFLENKWPTLKGFHTEEKLDLWKCAAPTKNELYFLQSSPLISPSIFTREKDGMCCSYTRLGNRKKFL